MGGWLMGLMASEVAYLIGSAFIVAGMATLWWVATTGRRERRRLRGRIVVLPPMTRYDEHLLRTDQTKYMSRVPRGGGGGWG
jgi:hypothetical protein